MIFFVTHYTFGLGFMLVVYPDENVNSNDISWSSALRLNPSDGWVNESRQSLLDGHLMMDMLKCRAEEQMHRLKVTEFNSYVKEDLMCFLLLLLRAQQVWRAERGHKVHLVLL